MTGDLIEQIPVVQRVLLVLARQAGTDATELTGRDVGLLDELDLPRIAYEAGEFEKSRQYATDQLNMVDSRKGQWDYGQLIYDGNVALGRLALHDGDVAKAGDYLLAAGKTPGSPPLDSFGPNMTLAKELLDRGQSGVVLQFLKECSAFWNTKDLKNWTAELQEGKTPDFSMNMDY